MMVVFPVTELSGYIQTVEQMLPIILGYVETFWVSYAVYN
jgi:hypothetical protein